MTAPARSEFAIAEEPAFGSMPNRRWDVEDWYGNPAKAAECLGWNARVPLAKGLRATYAWQRGVDYAGLKALSHSQGEGKATEISAIIACCKDAKAIPEMHARLAAVFAGPGPTYEIIFVNDCPPDDSREVLRKLSVKDPNVVAVEHTRNFGSVGVPYLRPERKYGTSTNSLLKNVAWAKKGILSFTYKPLEVMGYVGVALFFLSLSGIVWQVIGRLRHPLIPRGVSTIISITLFLGGMQLLCMAVLGEYIAKIFEEAKGRPLYIRHSLTHAGVE